MGAGGCARGRARQVKIRGSRPPAPAEERADGRAARSVPSRPLLHPLLSRPGRLLARPLACILTPNTPLPCKTPGWMQAECCRCSFLAIPSRGGASLYPPAVHPPELHTRPCLQARAPFAATSSHPGPQLTSPAARPIACCPLLLQPGSPRCLPQPPPRPLPAARVRSAALPPPGTHRRRLLLLLRLLLLGSGLQRTEPEAAPPSPAPPAPPANPPGPAGGRSLDPARPVPAPGVPASALGGLCTPPSGEGGDAGVRQRMGTSGPLGAGRVPSRAGTERCGLRRGAPTPVAVGPKLRTAPGPCALGRSLQFEGWGRVGYCVCPDQEEERAVTFSDCGQGTTAAS